MTRGKLSPHQKLHAFHSKFSSVDISLFDFNPKWDGHLGISLEFKWSRESFFGALRNWVFNVAGCFVVGSVIFLVWNSLLQTRTTIIEKAMGLWDSNAWYPSYMTPPPKSKTSWFLLDKIFWLNYFFLSGPQFCTKLQTKILILVR